MFRHCLLPIAAALLAVSAEAQTTHQVTLQGVSFTPANLNIAVGDTVDFLWVQGLHNVVSGVGGVPDGAFDTGAPVNTVGLIESVTFDQAFLSANPMPGNTYDYYCIVHLGFGMVGTITVDQALNADVASVSLSAGGVQTLTLNPPAPVVGDLFLLLGSLSGSSPGFPVDGQLLPLNPDAYSIFLLNNPNTVLAPTLGTLATGVNATVSIPAGSNPALVGSTASHAYLALNPITAAATFASNAVTLDLTP